LCAGVVVINGLKEVFMQGNTPMAPSIRPEQELAREQLHSEARDRPELILARQFQSDASELLKLLETFGRSIHSVSDASIVIINVCTPDPRGGCVPMPKPNVGPPTPPVNLDSHAVTRGIDVLKLINSSDRRISLGIKTYSPLEHE
jgi:hypothetical protein